MTEQSEVVNMAELVLQLENAKVQFDLARETYKQRSGIGAVIGKIGLWKAARDAKESGLRIVNGSAIAPVVVSRAYFNTIEDF